MGYSIKRRGQHSRILLRPNVIAAASLLVLAGCAADGPGENSGENPGENLSADQRIIKVTRPQVTWNLYDAHVAVSTFCLYGGVYAQTANSENGFYGYNSVDSLRLQHSQGGQLVTYYFVEGEEGWLRVKFGVGGEERYDFFINPNRQLATCGVDGLTNFREVFRAQSANLPVAEFGPALSRARTWRPRHWDSQYDDYAAHSDEVICAQATGRTFGKWDEVYWSVPYVEEAKKRGLTPQACVALLDDPVLDRNAGLDRLLADARRQIVTHWPNDASTGLSEEDLLRTFRVGYALEAYTKRLKRLPEAPEKDAILSEMKKLFARLDEINAESDDQLLETDERELLVPLIIAAAEVTGLDPSEFPYGDPTAEFRNF